MSGRKGFACKNPTLVLGGD